MLLWAVLILSFLASLIPSIREKGKLQSPIYLKIIGSLVVLNGLIFTFYLYPKITNIYSSLNEIYDPNKQYLLMNILVIAIGAAIFAFGLKLKKFMMTDFGYYFMQVLIFILLGICAQILVTTTINPIYYFTQNIK